MWADERLVSLNERDFTLSFCVEDSSLPVWGFYSTWSLREITIPGSMTLFEAAIELLTTPEEYDEIDKIFRVLLQGNLETLKHNLEAGL